MIKAFKPSNDHELKHLIMLSFKIECLKSLHKAFLNRGKKEDKVKFIKKLTIS